MPIVVVGELPDPEFGQSELLRLGDALIVRQIGEMNRRFAAARVVLAEYVTECATAATFSDAGLDGLGNLIVVSHSEIAHNPYSSTVQLPTAIRI